MIFEARRDPTLMKAMYEEIIILLENDTWDVVPVPRDAHLVGSKLSIHNKI